MKIAVLSDTHIPSKVKSLPSDLLDEIQGVDLIVHAGDLVDISVYEKLKEIAPVRAVAGNVDKYSVRSKLPAQQEFVCGDFKIGLIHGHQFKNGLHNKLLYRFSQTDIIIYGHTHKPYNNSHDGVLLFNPGSPTDKRLQSHYSYGIITLENELNSRIIKFK